MTIREFRPAHGNVEFAFDVAEEKALPTSSLGWQVAESEFYRTVSRDGKSVRFGWVGRATFCPIALAAGW